MRIPRFISIALTGALALLAFSAAPALAAPEEPATEKPTALTGTTVTFRGEPNPKAEAEVGYHFAYSTTGTCTEGAATSFELEAKLAAGTKVTSLVTGLEALTQYTVCIAANNPEGETVGTASQQTFTTLASAPVIGAEGNTGTGEPPYIPFRDTLQAEVNPENEVLTSCVFEYGPTSSYGKTQKCTPPALEGPAVETASTLLTGLESGQTGHFRVIVKNSAGETKGPDAEFTAPTAKAPGAALANVTGVVSVGATTVHLEANVVPFYQETQCTVIYWPDGAIQAEGVTVPCTPEDLGDGDENVHAPASLTGLSPGATYHFRFLARNTGGQLTETEPFEFTTLGKPAATTGAAEDPTRSTVLLSGTVSSAGAPTTYRFVYVPASEYKPGATGCEEGFACAYQNGTSGPSADAGEGYGTIPVGPVEVSGLKPDTTYDYALVATNSVGSGVGPNGTFTTTAGTPPLVTTGEATGVSQSSATLLGSVDTQNLETVTGFEFAAATLPAACGTGVVIPAAETPGGTVPTVAFTLNYSGVLAPGTTYFYRALATGPDGTACGSGRSFTTPSLPATLETTSLAPVIPYVSIAAINAQEAKEGKPAPSVKSLTNTQKLAKALKACTKKPKHQRAGCERQARKRYASAKKKKR